MAGGARAWCEPVRAKASRRSPCRPNIWTLVLRSGAMYAYLYTQHLWRRVMRAMMALGSTVGGLVAASACATAARSSMTSRYDAVQSTQPMPRSGGVLDRVAGGSVIAEAVAQREGPRVSIRAEVSSFADSRRVRGVFHVEDDAYVI